MATFEYHALTQGGRLMRGSIESASRDEAEATLRGMQLEVRSLAKAAPSGPRTAIGRSEFLLFNQQLASIAEAGIPLERSLRELSGELSSRRMRRLIDAIATDLEGGRSIEEAFAAHGRHFPPLYGRIVAAGVRTGRLGEMLASLNRHLALSAHTRRIVFEALCYPIVIMVLAAGVITALLLWVVPNFEAIYEGFEMELPALTRGLFWMAHHAPWVWGGVAAVVVALVAAKLALSARPAGRRVTESVYLGFPVLGRIYRAGLLARLAEGMATLIDAGCDLPEALHLGAEATGSENLKAEAAGLAGWLRAGTDLGELIQAGRIVPGLFLYSVQFGAQRNELTDNLHMLAEMYAEQARAQQGRLQAVLMPVMLVSVGVVVGFGIAGLFLPLPALIQSMQGY